MITICVDACFLIALYDEKEGKRHTEATNWFSEYIYKMPNKLVVPWPILFETVSTRMVKQKNRLHMLEKNFRTLKEQQRLELLNDLDYREKALEECFKETQKQPSSYRPLSLVDRVIRNMLSDVNLKIDYFMTFDIGHFEDVCKRFRRTIIEARNT